jgi:hypothetical protein
MKTQHTLAFAGTLAALLFALFLPSAQVRSQLAAPPSDPASVLQALQTANEAFLKRQEATLKEIDELNTTAREVRIFSKRG